MERTFNNVPVDIDTRITFQKEIEIKNFKALYQKWNWDGIIGESIIFHNDDVASLNDDGLKELINSSGLEYIINDKSTISRDESGFTFINFGF